MNLWSTDSIIDVFKNLVAGLAGQWIPKGCRWGTPSGSSIRSRPETSYDSLSEYVWKVLAKNPKLILDDF